LAPVARRRRDREDLGFDDEDEFLAALLGEYLSPAFLATARMRGGEKTARLPAGPAYRWSSVRDDPWRRLPVLDDAMLARLAGREGLSLRAAAGSVRIEVEVASGAPQTPGMTRRPKKRPDLRPDLHLDLRRESVLFLPGAGGDTPDLVLVRGDLAALYGALLRSDAASGPQVLGLSLPLRQRRRVGLFESGGTATPLVVFRSVFRRDPATEVELLALPGAAGSSFLRRIGEAAVVGRPLEFVAELAGAARVVLPGGESVTAESVRTVPTAAGSVCLVLEGAAGSRSSGTPPSVLPCRLPYRIPVLPPIELELQPRSGPPAAVREAAPFVFTVRSHLESAVVARLEIWQPPEVELCGLPDQLQLDAGEERAIPCALQVEADRPAGAVDLRLLLRRGATELGRVRRRIHTARGRDFLRLGFERRRRSLRPDGWRGIDAGDWRVRIGRDGAACGSACLRLDDGGGSRYGRHVLMAPSPLSFDTEQFPYLTFFLRANERDGARAAINLRVGTQMVAIPLVGDFVRAWDQRQELPAAGFVCDGKWQRVVYDLDAALDRVLGDHNHRVSSIDVGDTRALCSNRYRGEETWQLDLDEFAVVRRPKLTPGDALRDLTERFRRGLSLAAVDMLENSLAKIDPGSLGRSDVVDFELLRHALAFRRVAAGLPAKQPGQPVGRERFAAMLRHRHHLEHDCEELLRIGRSQMRELGTELDKIAGEIAAGKGWRQVAEILKTRHPSAAELPKLAEKAMQLAMEFTIEKELVRVPMAARDARVRVVTRGSLSRTYPFGGYGGVRRSARGFTGTYFVSPPADWMDEKQAAERLAGNHRAWTRVVALHEIVPGHHLQTVLHEMRPLTRFRRLFYSTVFAEGWALYCEEMLYQRGFFPDLDTRFTQLQMRLWRAARIVVDVSLHTGLMTREQAVQYLVQKVALDENNAEAEVARYMDNPTRPMSYLMGYLMIEDLCAEHRKAAGAAFSTRAFLDELLSFGPVPLPAIALGMRR